MLGSMQQERLMPSTVGSKTASDPVGTSSVSSLNNEVRTRGTSCNIEKVGVVRNKDVPFLNIKSDIGTASQEFLLQVFFS
jgi:hypothetical protein